MMGAKATRVGRESEEGYVLLFAVFFLALLVLSLAVAAPQVAKSIQRDRDLETFHRGMQYRRAVQLYYRSFHAYPPNLDALVKTNNIRFLRKKYIDPITGKDDWKPIMFGQNKTPTAMGFFGQPLAGNASSIAGIGPSGGNLPNSSGTGSILPGGISSMFGGGSTGSIFGSSASDNSSGNSTGTNGGTGSTTPSNGSNGSSGSSSSSTSSDQSSGPTFGGLGIIGFEPASAKQSILIYKKKQHYNEWEFTYDPLSDMQTISGGNAGALGQPASSTSSPNGSSNTPGFGGTSSSPGSIFGASPNPTQPSTPPGTSAPQQ
jgi:hypothetical protein